MILIMDLSRCFPPSLLDQSFGLCISPDDLIFPSYNFHRTNYYRPWKWYMQRAEKDFGSTIHTEKDRFKIALDVQHFKPEEIKVKIADSDIIIEGKHEERQDNHGFISREFKRRYFLPHDCDADSVFSSLSSDGVLTITASKMKELKNKEIIVPIKMCETCPKKDHNTKIENKEQVKEDSIITQSMQQGENETSKKKMEIMLKEDHCCLLRPELFGASSIKGKVETKKVNDDLFNTAMETCEMTTKMKILDKMDSACGIGSAVRTENSGPCEMASTEVCHKTASGISSTEKTKTDTCKSSTTEKIENGKASMEMTETLAKGVAETVVSEATSAGKSGKAETLLCDVTSAGKSEKAETLLCGLSSTEKTGQTESVACGITSEVLTEKAETSTSAKSEISSIKSMLSETIQESSTSYSSSMASSIKETTEKISEIVSDISAQLKEAAENI